MKKLLLSEFTTRELKDLIEKKKIDSAITVFGSCESHGDHLPLGADTFVPAQIARRVALELEKTIVVPEISFGTSIHYNQYPLSLTLRYETTIAIAQDIFASLIINGIKHILILNGHDGNIPALEIAARKIKDNYKEAVLVYVPAWWEITGAKMTEDFKVWNGLGHGGEGETSIVMAVNPELVDLQYARTQIPDDVIKLSEFVDIMWDIKEITSTGATGDPTKATVGKGKKMLNLIAKYLVDLIIELEKNNWDYDLRKGRK
jgi:creatinine amidohydrolase